MSSDGTRHAGQVRNTLSPLPGPPAKLRRGYLWANLMVGAVYVATLVLVGFGFFTIPYVDPVRSGAWFFVIALMLMTPAAILVAVLSCLAVYILRRTIAENWPGPLQALPAVIIVFGLLAVLVRVLFAHDASTPSM